MELEVYSPISAEAEVKSYTLVGDDIYVKRYTNENIPDWYRQLISDIIATDNTITDLDAAVDYLSTLPAGYDQKITELQLADTTINTSLTSLVATTGSHTAAIASLNATKVDATSAAAIAQTTVGSYFASADAGAWFNSKISTYASDIAANAMNISTLSATVNGHTVMIEDISSVSIDPVTGYMLGASKIGTAPDGSITGWQFADGTNVQSSFKIMATNFSVSDGTTGYTPFSISGSDVVFNGKVAFTNVTGTSSLLTTGTAAADINTNTTTIDGGKITTGSITSGQVAADAITGKTIIGGTITGSVLNGVLISGSIIRSSYMDLSQDSVLTNWKYITDINTIPMQYWANFANVAGTPIVDDQGYYRLITTDPAIITANSEYMVPQTTSWAIPTYTYDYYQVFGKKPVTGQFYLIPFTNPGGYATVGRGYVQAGCYEYCGGKIDVTFNILGNTLRFEGYTEKHHYEDLSYNTSFLKMYYNGTLTKFANASGVANGSENGIPPGYYYGYYVQKTFIMGALPVRVRMLATDNLYFGQPQSLVDIEDATSDRFPDSIIDGKTGRHSSAMFDAFLVTSGVSTSTKLGRNPTICFVIDVNVPFPVGAVCSVNTGYSGPLYSVTHEVQQNTWSYNNIGPTVFVQNQSYQLGKYYV